MLLRDATKQIGLTVFIVLSTLLPQTAICLLVSLQRLDQVVWLAMVSGVPLSCAMPVAAQMSKSNRLPLCALIIASLAAGIVWSIMLFVAKAAGMSFLWLIVGTALTGTALAVVRHASKLLSLLLFLACASQLLLCAGSFALASGMLSGFIQH